MYSAFFFYAKTAMLHVWKLDFFFFFSLINGFSCWVKSLMVLLEFENWGFAMWPNLLWLNENGFSCNCCVYGSIGFGIFEILILNLWFFEVVSSIISVGTYFLTCRNRGKMRWWLHMKCRFFFFFFLFSKKNKNSMYIQYSSLYSIPFPNHPNFLFYFFKI